MARPRLPFQQRLDRPDFLFHLRALFGVHREDILEPLDPRRIPFDNREDGLEFAPRGVSVPLSDDGLGSIWVCADGPSNPSLT